MKTMISAKKNCIYSLLFIVLSFPSYLHAIDNNSLWIDAKKSAPLIELNLPSFAPIIEKLGKSVVSISIEGKEDLSSQYGEGFGGNSTPFSPFDYYFQIPPEQGAKRQFEGMGSGFVINTDGYIITNNHVIDRATKITIKLKDDKTEYLAKVIGRDTKTDIALLKIDGAKDLSPVILADSDTIVPGDWVIAIGNPFNLGHTATVGIVSAKSRRNVGGPYNDFIQTDASINPGNSGGPLFNARGEVVGINSAIFSPGRFGSSGFNIGIGFATPINIAKEIVSQLHNGGKVVRGWLGVLIQPVTPDTAKALGISSASGALVADVVKDSPAEKAEIKRGDVIIEFDGQKIDDNSELPQIVGRSEIGKTVSLKVLRDRKEKTFKVKIEELKESEPQNAEDEDSEERKLGLTVQEISPDIAKGLGLEETKGVVIAAVKPDGAGARAGLQRGDVVLEVGGKDVNTAKDFYKNTKDLDKENPLLLLIRRGDHTVFVTVKAVE